MRALLARRISPIWLLPVLFAGAPCLMASAWLLPYEIFDPVRLALWQGLESWFQPAELALGRPEFRFPWSFVGRACLLYGATGVLAIQGSRLLTVFYQRSVRRLMTCRLTLQ